MAALMALIGVAASALNNRVMTNEVRVLESERRLNGAEQAIVVMQTDIKYMRQGVDDIKGMLRKDGH